MTAWTVTTATRTAGEADAGDATTTAEALDQAFDRAEQLIRDHEHAPITITVGGWSSMVYPQGNGQAAEDVAGTLESLESLRHDMRANVLAQ
jgi:hypothetical protein